VKHVATAVVYRSRLFRDCVCAVLRRNEVVKPVAVEMSKFRPERVRKADALVVEIQPRDQDWREVINSVMEHEDGPRRVVIVGMSFAHDEMQVVAFQRLGNGDPAQLSRILAVWSDAAGP